MAHKLGLKYIDIADNFIHFKFKKKVATRVSRITTFLILEQIMFSLSFPYQLYIFGKVYSKMTGKNSRENSEALINIIVLENLFLNRIDVVFLDGQFFL